MFFPLYRITYKAGQVLI